MSWWTIGLALGGLWVTAVSAATLWIMVSVWRHRHALRRLRSGTGLLSRERITQLQSADARRPRTDFGPLREWLSEPRRDAGGRA